MIESVLLLLATLLLAPFGGAVLAGFDRRVTARLQGRIGPPLSQPFYDALKLFGKRGSTTSKFQIVSTWVYFTAIATTLALVVLGQDLIVALFVLALGSVAFILGGFSVKSPYSQLGSQREVMQLLTYEPLLLLMVIGFYLHTGSFTAGAVVQHGKPMLPTMPLFFATMLVVLLIKLRKSPFDTAASAHHAHQEVVRGPLTELSGPTLGLIEIAHWYEFALLIVFVGLLWAVPVWAGLLLGLVALFAAVLVDNVTARMTWGWMVRFGWIVGFGLSLANLAWLYANLGNKP